MQGTEIKGGYSLFEEVAPFDFPLSRGDGVCSALRCMDSAALSATARQRGILSFRREYPPLDPPRERRGDFPLDPAHWQSLARRAAQPAEWGCLLGFAAIRLGLLLLPAAALESCRKFQQSPPTTDFFSPATACRGRHCFARRRWGGYLFSSLLNRCCRWIHRG